MKPLFTVILTLSLLIMNTPAHAGDEGAKGASSTAYEHASDQSVFNRAGDWFATIGKSPEEKEAILEQRRQERAARRAEKEMRKTEKADEKEMRKTEKADEKEMRQEEKAAEKEMRKTEKAEEKEMKRTEKEVEKEREEMGEVLRKGRGNSERMKKEKVRTKMKDRY
jgi:hypothetical protein